MHAGGRPSGGHGPVRGEVTNSVPTGPEPFQIRRCAPYGGGPNAGVVFVGTRKNDVYAVTDRDKDRVADEVKVFAPSSSSSAERRLLFQRRHSVRREQNRVLQFPAAEFFYEGPDVAAFQVLNGELIPSPTRLQSHCTGLPGRARQQALHRLGQPFNVPPKDKLDLYKQRGSAASSAWTGTARIARSTRRDPQFGRHRFQSR